MFMSYPSKHEMTTRHKAKQVKAYEQNGNKDPKKRTREDDTETGRETKVVCISHPDFMES